MVKSARTDTCGRAKEQSNNHDFNCRVPWGRGRSEEKARGANDDKSAPGDRNRKFRFR